MIERNAHTRPLIKWREEKSTEKTMRCTMYAEKNSRIIGFWLQICHRPTRLTFRWTSYGVGAGARTHTNRTLAKEDIAGGRCNRTPQ